MNETSPPNPASPSRGRRFWKVLAFTGGERRSVGFIVVVTIAVGGMNALEPLLMKAIVDNLIAEQRPVRPILWAVGGLLALYGLREGANAITNWLHWRTRLKVQSRLLDTTVGRLNALSLAYHRKEAVGSLLTKLDRGIQGLVGAFSELAFNLLPALVFLVMAVVLMLRLEWRLSLVLFALVPVPALIGMLAAPAQTERDRTLLDRWTRIYARFNEVLSGIITVKSFAMEHEEKQRFVRQVSEANDIVVKGVGFESRVTAAQNLVIAATRVVVIGYGAYLAWHGQITVGTLMAFLGYLTGLFGPVQGLTALYQTMRRASVSLDSIFSILEAKDDVTDVPGARDLHIVRGDVQFENVWFGYAPNRFVLRGINFDVRGGQTVALVGPSGGGKTTMAILLQRLYEQQEGEIRIDGVDLRTVTQRSLRKQIGVVLQDASLFNDSVRANIAYGRPDASMADIQAAARAANAHEFIEALQGGYDFEVGERGGLLSAGQRQRIAIARAVLKNPPIVILDEATSALDAESEHLVQDALGRLLAGRTTFIIAHRLATVVKADQILVLRSGRIIETGTHDALMAKAGYYASLVTLQTRGLLLGGFPEKTPQNDAQGPLDGGDASAETRAEAGDPAATSPGVARAS